jgi:hypothetical protein
MAFYLHSYFFALAIRPYKQRYKQMNTRLPIYLLLTAYFISKTACATTYYVDSANGSNNFDGKTTTTAWQNVAAVNARTFASGDKILFSRGRSFVYNSPLRLKGSGVIIDSFGSGSLPQLQNTSTNMSGCVVDLSASSSSTVQNLVITNTSGSVRVAGVCLAGTGNQVLNLDISKVGIGVAMTGSGHRVDNNYIHDLQMVVNTPGGNDDYGAMGVKLAHAYNVQIAHNRFERLKASSYDFGYDGTAIEFYNGSSNVEFFGNQGKDLSAMTEMGGSSTSEYISNVSFHHNVILNADNLAWIHIAGGNTSFGIQIANIKLENNTFVNTTYNYAGNIIGFAKPPAANTVFIRNNIFDIHNPVGTLVYQAGATIHDGNLYNLTGTNSIGYSLSTREKKGNPSFVNSTAGDFHINSMSPAIDSGLSIGYVLDKDGNNIWWGKGPDAGAHEYYGS